MSDLDSACQLIKSGNSSIIELKGEVNILQAAALKKLLVKVTSGTEPIRIDMSALDELDISIIQLLCASKNKAIENGLGFDISPISERGQELLRCSGTLYNFISPKDKN